MIVFLAISFTKMSRGGNVRIVSRTTVGVILKAPVMARHSSLSSLFNLMTVGSLSAASHRINGLRPHVLRLMTHGEFLAFSMILLLCEPNF